MHNKQISMFHCGLASAFVCSTLGFARAQQHQGNFGEPPNPIPVGTHQTLDNIQEPVTDVGVIPIRPLAITSDNGQLYVANVHDSKVRSFDFAGGSGTQDWQVPWAPVSLGIYDTADKEWLIVVCGGTHCAAVLDRHSGQILELIALPFEPADLLINAARHEAYVSCSGADSLAVINLNTLQVTEILIPAEHPAHLAFDPRNPSDPLDDAVLIAPMISGNNSTALKDENNVSFVVDLDDPTVSPYGLPDEDCFRFDPVTWELVPIARQVGTNLFAHGINPVTQEHWQLNFEALNKDPSKQSEAAIRGEFGLNRVTLTSLPAATGELADKDDHSFVHLDDANPATPAIEYDSTLSVGLPTGLAFGPTGVAAITGLATDNITLLDPLGHRITEWNLPDGSLPRAVIVDPVFGAIVIVYCWGTNEVLMYDASTPPAMNSTPTPFVTLDIGYDPTPPLRQAGRRVFFDAQFSMHGNLTCGSCHIDGRTDLLAWNLSESPIDEKEALVTQTLKSLESVAPYHWRGDRPTLRRFNPAFDDLLGGAPLTDTQFEQFQAYVFSLQSPANPRQDERNILNDALAVPREDGLVPSAVRGQGLFTSEIALVNTFTCADCHALPTGTDADMVNDGTSLNPSGSRFQPTAFNELWRKDLQPLVTVDLVDGGSIERAKIGAGLLHDGDLPDSIHFIDPGVFLNLSTQQAADIAAYVHQLPSAVAPVAHKAELFDSEHTGTESRIRNYLLDQAEKGYADVAVFGVYPKAGIPMPVNWVYRSSSQTFEPDDPGLAAIDFDDFVTATLAGQASNIFVGLPLGNGERAAIDWDNDALINGAEALYLTDPKNPDSDGDGYPDGHEVLHGGAPTNPAINSQAGDNASPVVENVVVEWVNTKNARMTFTTNEPARIDVEYHVDGGPLHMVSEPDFATVHSVLLNELVPSTVFSDLFASVPAVENEYVVTIRAYDPNPDNLPGEHSLTITSRAFKDIKDRGVAVGVIQGWQEVLSSPNYSAGTIDIIVELTVDSKEYREAATGSSQPLGGRVAICQVIVDGQIWSQFSASDDVISSFCSQSFDQNSGMFVTEEFTARPGPFVVSSPSDAAGVARIEFSLWGLQSFSPGTEIVVNPIIIQEAGTIDLTAPCPIVPLSPGTVQFVDHSFVDTVTEQRWLTLEY